MPETHSRNDMLMIDCACGCANYLAVEMMDGLLYLNFGRLEPMRPMLSLSEWRWDIKYHSRLILRRMAGKKYLLWEVNISRDKLMQLSAFLSYRQLEDTEVHNSSYLRVSRDPDTGYWLELVSRQPLREAVFHPGRGYEIVMNRALRDHFIKTLMDIYGEKR